MNDDTCARMNTITGAREENEEYSTTITKIKNKLERVEERSNTARPNLSGFNCYENDLYVIPDGQQGSSSDLSSNSSIGTSAASLQTRQSLRVRFREWEWRTFCMISICLFVCTFIGAIVTVTVMVNKDHPSATDPGNIGLLHKFLCKMSLII